MIRTILLVVSLSAVHAQPDRFWAKSANPDDPIAAARRGSFFGLLLDGPPEAALVERQTLPLFAYYMGTYRQLAARSFGTQGILVAIDPDANTLYLKPAVGAPGPSASDPKDLPEGTNIEAHTLEARGLLALPWGPGRLISQLLLKDLSSNRVTTVLRGPAMPSAQPRDPEDPYPSTGSKYPVWTRTNQSPEPPAGFGLVLKTGGGHLLHGAWRLPIRSEEIVNPDHAAYNRQHKLMQPNGKKPYAACVSIYLVILTDQDSNPFTYRVRQPIAALANGNEASGYFTVDLAALPQFPVRARSLYLHGYAKEWMANPVTWALPGRGGR